MLGDTIVPSKPNNLRISLKGSNVELRWLPPLSTAHVEAYEVEAKDVTNGRTIQDSVSGSTFAHVFSSLNPGTTYNISVRARADTGHVGDAASQIFGVPGDGSSASLQLSNMRIEETDNQLIASWDVDGEASNVRAYQVSYRSSG